MCNISEKSTSLKQSTGAGKALLFHFALSSVCDGHQCIIPLLLVGLVDMAEHLRKQLLIYWWCYALLRYIFFGNEDL